MKRRQPATASVVLLLICSVLVLGLAACGGGDDEGDQGTPPGATGTATTAAIGEPVEITMWHAEVASNLDTLQNLVRRYNSSQNEVRVKLAFQGSDEELMAERRSNAVAKASHRTLCCSSATQSLSLAWLCGRVA